MSTYESLLEDYNYDERLENVSFEEMGNMIDSLTEFVSEEVNCTVEISLQEAESESIKDKVSKIGQGIKNTCARLIAKIKRFIARFIEAVKAFLAKAKVVIQQGGNKALGALLKGNGAKTKKAIKLKSTNNANIVHLFTQAGKAEDDIAGAIDVASKQGAEKSGVDVPGVPASVENVISAFKTRFEDSAVVKDVEIPADSEIKTVYAKEVKPYLEAVKKGVDYVDKHSKQTRKEADKLIKTLEKAKDTRDANAEAIAKIAKLSNATMQVSTASLRFASSVLSICTKNSAKLALAAGRAALPGGKKKEEKKDEEKDNK